MCVERGVPRSARQVLVRAVGNVLPDKKNLSSQRSTTQSVAFCRLLRDFFLGKKTTKSRYGDLWEYRQSLYIVKYIHIWIYILTKSRYGDFWEYRQSLYIVIYIYLNTYWQSHDIESWSSPYMCLKRHILEYVPEASWGHCTSCWGRSLWCYV